MEEKKSFVLYHDLADMMVFLTIPQRGELITAIFEYVKEGKTQIALDVPTQIVFTSVRQNLDRDCEKYLEKCRINAENGKKGGRPRKNQHVEKSERFFEKAEKADNDNDNENDNDNDNDNDNENGGENENENENARESRSADATDLAARGMVPPPPPPPQNMLEELRELGVPLYYAEERLERAEYFAEKEHKSVTKLLSEWWENDRQGTPPNRTTTALSPPPNHQKTYDIDEFFQAALERALESDCFA